MQTKQHISDIKVEVMDISAYHKNNMFKVFILAQ